MEFLRSRIDIRMADGTKSLYVVTKHTNTFLNLTSPIHINGNIIYMNIPGLVKI